MSPLPGAPEQVGASQIDAAIIAARWIAETTGSTDLHDDPPAEAPNFGRLHPDVVRVLRGMSGMERLRLAHEAWELARERLTALFTATRPDWSPDRVRQEVAARMGRTQPG